MKLLVNVIVTGFGFLAYVAAAAQRPGVRAGRAGEPALLQRIETSRGTCECVPYYNCDADNTVDTTIFRIRGKRQIEERPEQCMGLNVCCLVNKNNNTNNNNNNGENNNNNNGGSQPENPVSTSEPCVCLPSFQCGLNDTEVFQGGKGIIVPKIICDAEEVLCCDKSFTDGVTPDPGSTGGSGDTGGSIPSACGTRNKNIDFNLNRIMNSGSGDGTTLFGEYPWMLVILKSERLPDGSFTNNVFTCGASLIQPGIAITAAHCVHLSEPGDLKVRAGEWDTRENNVAETLPYQEQRVAEIILHPRFNNGTLHNDVAILRLESPFTLADNVGLICLPSEKSRDPTNCIATGWGKEAFTKESKYQNVMKQVSLPYVKPSECQSQLRSTRLGQRFILDKSFNCAGGQTKQDTCQGDGGGPLSCIVDGDDHFFLIGITSWGIGCGTENVPGVYTNVRLFSDWISSYLQ